MNPRRPAPEDLKSSPFGRSSTLLFMGISRFELEYQRPKRQMLDQTTSYSQNGTVGHSSKIGVVGFEPTTTAVREHIIFAAIIFFQDTNKAALPN